MAGKLTTLQYSNSVKQVALYSMSIPYATVLLPGANCVVKIFLLNPFVCETEGKTDVDSQCEEVIIILYPTF